MIPISVILVCTATLCSSIISAADATSTAKPVLPRCDIIRQVDRDAFSSSDTPRTRAFLQLDVDPTTIIFDASGLNAYGIDSEKRTEKLFTTTPSVSSTCYQIKKTFIIAVPGEFKPLVWGVTNTREVGYCLFSKCATTESSQKYNLYARLYKFNADGDVVSKFGMYYDVDTADTKTVAVENGRSETVHVIVRRASGDQTLKFT